MMLRRIREWLGRPQRRHDELMQRLDIVSRRQGAVEESMAAQSKDIRATMEKFMYFGAQLDAKVQPLFEFRAAMAAAGITQKFGHRIDVDYDRFLALLDFDSIEELKRVIADREEQAMRTWTKPVVTEEKLIEGPQ